jgi:beta-xylosidase
MTASSFTNVPGLPILHSKDLVHWHIIGHALQKLQPAGHFSKVQHGGGVWAPAIRYHNKKFYIYYPDPDFGIYVITATSITGPWSDPILVEAGKGLIDPCPLWDDDGKNYLVHAYAGSRAGFKSILVIKQLDTSATKVMGNTVMVFDGHQNDPTVEGPKLYKRNGWYYIFAPAGGVSTGWQLALRSKNIYGPYERKVVLQQGKTAINGPHQGAWVNTPAGEDWFLHFQDKDAYGRVVHLQPMQWKNDWPVIGSDADGDGTGEPVETYKKPATEKKHKTTTPAESDEFSDPQLGLQWQWQANPKEGWALPTASGFLRMFSVYAADSLQNLWSLPNILAQKLPAESFRVRMKFSFNPKHENEQLGLIMFGTDYGYIAVQKKESGLFLVCNENIRADKNSKEKEVASFPLQGNDFIFGMEVDKGGICHFNFSDDKKNITEITQSFTAKPGRWVGAKIGIFCTRGNNTNDAGYADIDWVRFEKK